MKALQYIYTSWKNGDSVDKGYMIYSKSEGITNEECDCIKELMQYMPPKGLKMNPTQEEIAELFPYNFAYFVLPTGRLCVSNTTYLGKDYSGRYGNYIIHALVFEKNELTAYPVELFAESYIKTFMTDEELHAASPVPPLPILEIDDECANFINDDVVTEFVETREQECDLLLSAVMEGIRLKKPVYINDTRENLVLWMAVIQKVVPIENAKNFTFSTYIGNQDAMRTNTKLNLSCIGVRPDANYFDYRVEKESSRHIVLDFINNIRSNNLVIEEYASIVSKYIANSSDHLNKFKSFLSSTKYSGFDEKIIQAIKYFSLLNDDVELNNDKLLEIINFGEIYCNKSDNSKLAEKLLQHFQKSLPIFEIQDMKKVFTFLFQNAGHMLSVTYGVLYDTIFELVGNMSINEISKYSEFFESCKKDIPLFVRGYLDYYISEEAMNSAKLYLQGNKNQVVIQYYLLFILENYDLSVRTNSNKALFQLVHILLKELFSMEDATKNVLAIMANIITNAELYMQIMSDYRSKLTNNKEISTFVTKVVDQMSLLEVDDYIRIENILLEKPEYQFNAIEIFSKLIETSNDPKKDFGYYFNKVTVRRFPPSYLSSMINAYLKVLDGIERVSEIVKLIVNLDKRELCSEVFLSDMINVLESSSLTDLGKIDTGFLTRIDLLCDKFKIPQSTIRTVLMGRSFSEMRTLSFPNAFEGELSRLSKENYKIFLETYVVSNFEKINNDEKFNQVMNRFAHNRYNDLFYSSYIQYLKQLEKKKSLHWEEAVTHACVYVIKNHQSPSVKVLESQLSQYLAKHNNENLLSLEYKLFEKKLGSYTNKFLELVKEGGRKKNIFNNFFKRS